MARTGLFWLAAGLLALLSRLDGADAYQVPISESDDTRQVCSGMWGGPGVAGRRNPWIDVIFQTSSQGNAALVIYEWKDARYLGVSNDGSAVGSDEWDDERVYICTLSAYRAGLCPEAALGQFIVSMPSGQSVNSTSIFTTAVRFGGGVTGSAPGAIGPFRYNISRTGYYCVGTVPITTTTADNENSSYAVNANSVYFNGVVDFENIFAGHLPAAEWPKIPFYFALGVVYAILGGVWGFFCWKNRTEILPIQNYVSATIAVIVVEMFSLYGYWQYLNRSGSQTMARVLLVLVSIVNAARNSLSFFLLCIVCMGFGIVRPSLGSVMIRVRLLALVHFLFGILYSIGTVTIPLESAGFFLFFFVMPLAFTLTAFMMWIMWSLQATIADLESRKQTYKKQMFVRLHRILLCAAIVIVAFFVISSISFSNRLDEDYAPDTWQTRFFLLDGWLGLLYLAVFCAIAWLWRPSPFNRQLAMSDEVAMDDDEQDYDIATMDGNHLHDDGGRHDYGEADAIPLPTVGKLKRNGLRDDDVVFDIGEDDDEHPRRPSKDLEEGDNEEAEHLFDDEKRLNGV